MKDASSAAVGFAGLSHLGIVSSLAAAARGFEVIAFDPRGGWCGELNAGRLPVREPGLDELFQQHRGRVLYTASLADLARCGLIFLSLDVATDDDNRSDTAPVRELIRQVAGQAGRETAVVVLSQVPPGFSRRMGRENFFYQVETLVFGNAVERALQPERFIIGCADPRAPLPEAYVRFLAAFGCPVLRMRYESAELAKIAINCFLASSVSTSNMLAEICERIGADWGEMIPALRLDRRIGPHAYLSPGLGIAGGNLERDLATVEALAAEYGADGGPAAAWLRNSAWRRDWALRLLHAKGLLARPGAVLAVWGLAYKPETHSTKNSPALALLDAIGAVGGSRVQAFDPAVTLEAGRYPRAVGCGSPLEAAGGADALILITPWKEFLGAPLEEVKKAMRGSLLLDPYGLLDRATAEGLGFEYHRLGAGRLSADASA